MRRIVVALCRHNDVRCLISRSMLEEETQHTIVAIILLLTSIQGTSYSLSDYSRYFFFQ